ncbi:hypothetical protein BGX28_002099, partial [Mortierella sp. GBA30]
MPTHFTILHTGMEPVSYWVNVVVKMAAPAVLKLKKFSEKKTAQAKGDFTKSLADLQSIEIEASVNGDEKFMPKISLGMGQRLQLIVNPKLQIKQATGFYILHVELIDPRKPAHVALISYRGRQVVNAESPVALLLRKPVELGVGGRMSFVITVGAQISQGGGFKLHHLELVDSHTKKRDAEQAPQNTIAQKKVPEAEQSSQLSANGDETVARKILGCEVTSQAAGIVLFGDKARHDSSDMLPQKLGSDQPQNEKGADEPVSYQLEKPVMLSEDYRLDVKISLSPKLQRYASFEIDCLELSTGDPSSKRTAALGHLMVPNVETRSQTDRKRMKEPQQPVSEVVSVSTYKIDSSGTKLATLSFDRERYYIDIWDIEEATHNPGAKGKTLRIDVAYNRTILGQKQHHTSSTSTPPPPQRLASLDAKIGKRLTKTHLKSVTIALSFAATQMALVPRLPAASNPQSFLLYKCQLKFGTLVDTIVHEDLASFVGYGDFHCVVLACGNTDTANEKFLACDGYSCNHATVLVGQFMVLMSRVFLVHTLQAKKSHPWPIPTVEGLAAARKLILNIRNRYFAWPECSKAVTIWDIERGSPVSYIQLPHEHKPSDTYVYMSTDGSITTVWMKGRGMVGTYWTLSGTRIKQYTDHAGIFGGQFLVTENQRPSGQIELVKTKSQLLNLLDGSKRHLGGDLRELHGAITISSTGNQILAHFRGPNVVVTGLDTAFAQLSEGKDCNNACNIQPSAISDDRIYHSHSESAQGRVLEFVRQPSGTKFALDRNLVSGKTLYELKLVDKDDVKERTLLVFSYNFKYAVLVGDAEHLILVDDHYVQVWMIPHTQSLCCRLLLIWSTKAKNGVDPVFAKPFRPQICRHSRILTMGTVDGQGWQINLSDPKVFSKPNAERFIGGMRLLLMMYINMWELEEAQERSDKQNRLLACAIIKYLSGYVNHNPTPYQPLYNVMAHICSNWNWDKREVFKDILRNILHERTWSPAPHYISYQDASGHLMSSNPINILLTGNNPRVINTAKLLYTYCLNRSIETGQIGYLTPVFDSLPRLLMQHRPHALKYFREMALIKASEVSFRQEMHTTAHLPQYHQQQRCSDDADSTVNEDENCKREVHVASFDMLWQNYSLDGEGDMNDLTMSQVLLYIAAQVVYPANCKYVKRHDIGKEFMDNPAIEALIDYKWNAIGFHYWRARFVSHCSFYALLHYVAMQQLCGCTQEILYNYFVAVGASASVFLCLYVIQLLVNSGRDS